MVEIFSIEMRLEACILLKFNTPSLKKKEFMINTRLILQEHVVEKKILQEQV